LCGLDKTFTCLLSLYPLKNVSCLSPERSKRSVTIFESLSRNLCGLDKTFTCLLSLYPLKNVSCVSPKRSKRSVTIFEMFSRNLRGPTFTRLLSLGPSYARSHKQEVVWKLISSRFLRLYSDRNTRRRHKIVEENA